MLQTFLSKKIYLVNKNFTLRFIQFSDFTGGQNFQYILSNSWHSLKIKQQMSEHKCNYLQEWLQTIWTRDQSHDVNDHLVKNLEDHLHVVEMVRGSLLDPHHKQLDDRHPLLSKILVIGGHDLGEIWEQLEGISESVQRFI